MRATFRQIIDEYIKKYHPNEYVAGRGSNYTIPDQIVRGGEILRREWAAPRGQAPAGTDGGDGVGVTDDEGEGEEEELTADDFSAEGMI